MSDSRILGKYTGRDADPGEQDNTGEGESVANHGSYGWLRGVRDRAAMVELRKKTGNVLAVGYGWIDRMEFNASVGIVLHMGNRQITIKGRNLNADTRNQDRLFRALARHRVQWIQEADEPTDLAAEPGSTIVEAIEW